ncbi:class I SAM-dependent methyltransferase [Paraclostridium sordellii]|uniref:class I SAM-dependent methyltransferase n=1 Tax=Paraclostridium sordellii TaxID=1505 RepID=UPI00189C2DA0|nr:class I SAM-dependent methyltransferase [Paeniclostridium sordellii]
MSNIYTSRFIMLNDEVTNICFMKIPYNWVSRKYEYKWAMNFIGSDDICLDSACGLPHPFKFFLASVATEVYAFDISPNIVDKSYILHSITKFFDKDDIDKAEKYIDKINFSVANLISLPYPNNFFTKIFCIGAISNLSNINLNICIKEFYRVLKNNGYLILTTDVPPTNIIKLINSISNNGFSFVGNLDLTKNENIFTTSLPSCNNCFRLLAKK